VFKPYLEAVVKLHEIAIHNYRSIADVTVWLKDYSLLIGANNSGKSNLIDALRTFYEKDLKFETSRDFPKFRTTDDESWVEIEYALTKDETATIKPEYLIHDNHFRVRKWLHPAEKAKEGIYGYERGRLSSSLFYGWKNVGQGKLGDIIYIPAVSRLEDHTKLSGPSALRDLINDILKPIIRSSKAFDSLSAQFAEFGKSIKAEETNDKRSLIGLEQRINEEISDWGAAFKLEVDCPREDDIVKNLIHHSLTDPELKESMEASSFGHGFQRYLIYTLLRISASYVSPRPEPKKKEFAPDLELLLFEEPEAFLHPPQQVLLDSSLRTLAETTHRQVLVATHSPQFVSDNADNIADLVRLSRVESRTRINQVNVDRLKDIFEDNQKIKALLGEGDAVALDSESEIELETIRHFLWLNADRCAKFFADKVLVVEGLSEQVAINYLIRTSQVRVPKSVFVLDASGKYNIHRFMNLLSELGIQHVVLHDLDQSKTGKQKTVQDAVNALVAASRTNSTLAIDVLPDNLETFLDIPMITQRWKPAEILIAIKANKVTPERRKAFIAKVEGLFISANHSAKISSENAAAARTA
jgi:putative ATP-dependent endonuclease of OLD family